MSFAHELELGYVRAKPKKLMELTHNHQHPQLNLDDYKLKNLLIESAEFITDFTVATLAVNGDQ